MIHIFNPLKKISQSDKLILESVKKFARSELPRFLGKNQHRDLYKEFGKLGILGCNVQSNLDFSVSNTMYGLICKEIEYIDSGFRSLVGVQSSLVIKTLNDYADSSIKKHYIQSLKEGNTIGSFCLTEAESGSDISAIKTYAKEDKGDYLINGNKTWITNAPIADIFIVWAKLNKKINGFIVTKNMKGLEVSEINNKLSMNETKTGLVYLDNVRVPKINRLKIEGSKGPLTSLNSARIGLSTGSLGAAEACIDISLDYVKNRKLFGTYLSQKQNIQSKLVDMITKYNASLALTLKILDLIDNDEYDTEIISMIKMNNPQISLDIARTSREILGGNGIINDYNVFRHMSNLETVNTYEGTHDIHKLILGKYFTGENAF